MGMQKHKVFIKDSQKAGKMLRLLEGTNQKRYKASIEVLEGFFA